MSSAVEPARLAGESHIDWSQAGDADSDVVWLVPRPDGRIRCRTTGWGRVRRSLCSVTTGLVFLSLWPASAIGPATALSPREALDVEPPPAARAAAALAPARFELAELPQPTSLVPLLKTNTDSQETMQFGQVSVRRQVVETLVRAASVTQTDPVYLMALADKESSFAPAVKASTSSAEGMFQFIERTWLGVIKRFGPAHGLGTTAAAIKIVDDEPVVEDARTREEILALRRDPFVSAIMAAEMLKRDRNTVESRLGRELTAAEYYLCHFLGYEEAARFMEVLGTSPQESAAKAFPAAARANRTIFYDRQRRRPRALTVAEVYDRFSNMIDSRLGRYGSVSAFAERSMGF